MPGPSVTPDLTTARVAHLRRHPNNTVLSVLSGAEPGTARPSVAARLNDGGRAEGGAVSPPRTAEACAGCGVWMRHSAAAVASVGRRSQWLRCCSRAAKAGPPRSEAGFLCHLEMVNWDIQCSDRSTGTEQTSGWRLSYSMILTSHFANKACYLTHTHTHRMSCSLNASVTFAFPEASPTYRC